MTTASFAKSLIGKKLVTSALADFIRREDSKIKSGKKSRKAGVVTDALLTIIAMKETIREFNHGEDFDGQELFHPSALGGCRRTWWFDAVEAPAERHDSPDDLLKSHLTFAIGTYFHLLFQNLCHRAGILVQREVPIHRKDLKILGHADGIVLIDGIKILLEIKTINGRNFIMLGDKPKYEHLLQVHAYMYSLGLKRASVVYFNKDTSVVKEFDVVFDPKIYADVRSRIDGHFKAVKTLRMPDKDGHSATAQPCSYCQFLSLCYTKQDLKDFLKKIGAK